MSQFETQNPEQAAVKQKGRKAHQENWRVRALLTAMLQSKVGCVFGKGVPAGQVTAIVPIVAGLDVVINSAICVMDGVALTA